MNKVFIGLLGAVISSAVFAAECDFIQLGRCQSCESLSAFAVNSNEACLFLCPNRTIYFRDHFFPVQRTCGLKQCPSSAPFQSEMGSCFETQLDAMTDFIPQSDNPVIIAEQTLPHCPMEQPLMDDAGICYACDVPVPVSVKWNTKTCVQYCSTQRYLLGNNCLLNT